MNEKAVELLDLVKSEQENTIVGIAYSVDPPDSTDCASER